ncbi:MAG: single-stranded-DNA-specific exonuclease RecJ [Acidobacteriota bacterium]|nr:single-stranded-DNA-specific exonuclease RecJ [Acidobacteriota bacterium]
MKKRWNLKRHDLAQVRQLANELNVAPLVAALLISRGYETGEAAHEFLNPSFEQILEPNLLHGMRESVERILKAIERGEKILVWGDYDVDGTTGTVVLRKALEILGAKTGFHVPHRFMEGYGLNVPSLEKAKSAGFSLVITVDCGSTAFEPIQWASENGIDVIVTDHHLTKEHGLPKAFSVVNPNQDGCPYPDKNLAGVGVAFKLAHALLREKGRQNLIKSFLKVVAIGTIADIMNLTGENRAIVSIGLQDLPKAKNPGLRALMEVAGCTSEMTAYDIGFRLAPRINAAGRMDAARAVVELFEADSFEKARFLAEHLDSRNRERQTIQKQITELAIQEIPQSAIGDPHFVVVAGDGWHRGVIGLAASKIAEKLHRPTIVISLENGVGHGSARSIKPYHLINGLDSCAELFEQYGGHAQAAGMMIKAENVALLRERLNAHCASCLCEDDLIPEIKIDAQVSTASLNLDLVRQLQFLEPFGAGNPRPVFATRDLYLAGEPLVMKEKHLKLRLADKERRQFEAVWWNGAENAQELCLRPQTKIELAYTPEVNVWNGNTRLQLVVQDLKEV